jgi:hypothetical protein
MALALDAIAAYEAAVEPVETPSRRQLKITISALKARIEELESLPMIEGWYWCQAIGCTQIEAGRCPETDLDHQHYEMWWEGR